jgi:hypothetical protein
MRCTRKIKHANNGLQLLNWGILLERKIMRISASRKTAATRKGDLHLFNSRVKERKPHLNAIRA